MDRKCILFLSMVIGLLGSSQLLAWAVFSEEPKTLQLKTEHSPKEEENTGHLGIFQKKASSLSLEEQAREDFYAALRLMQGGSDLQAEEKFLSVLNKIPNHLKSRSELANLYLRHNRDREAELLLEEGLKQAQNYPDFLKLQAMVHERRDEPEQALDLLSKLPETSRNDKQVVALFGHLYQQTGQYGLAKNQYDRLLKIDPNNINWLLGLSLALDSSGQKKAAIEVYRQLQLKNGLNTEISQFVEDRLKALKG